MSDFEVEETEFMCPYCDMSYTIDYVGTVDIDGRAVCVRCSEKMRSLEWN